MRWMSVLLLGWVVVNSELGAAMAQDSEPAVNPSAAPERPPAVTESDPEGLNRNPGNTAQENKAIVFLGRSRCSGPANCVQSLPSSRPQVLIYEGMKLDISANGEFKLTFRVEAPRTTTRIYLEFRIPYEDGSKQGLSKLTFLEGADASASATGPLDKTETCPSTSGSRRTGVVTIPPIVLSPSTDGPEGALSTVYRVEYDGHSPVVALAHKTTLAKGVNYVHVPGDKELKAGDKPSAPVSREMKAVLGSTIR